jgi:hypothetical protein
MSSSRITMKYLPQSTPSTGEINSDRDEVTVIQHAANGSAYIVFRGFLKAEGTYIHLIQTFLHS